MLYRTLSQAETTDIKSRILYEDNHLMIFNKRSGEIVQGDKTGDEPLSETLKAYIAVRDGKPGQVFLGVPHRLDRPVSGAVIFAKTSKALSRLAEMTDLVPRSTIPAALSVITEIIRALSLMLAQRTT